MSKSVYIKLNKYGFRHAIMQSDEMLKIVTRKAEEESTPGTHVKPFIGYDRAIAIVYRNTEEHPG